MLAANARTAAAWRTSKTFLWIKGGTIRGDHGNSKHGG